MTFLSKQSVRISTIFCAVAFFYFLACLRPIADFDFWYHLVIGNKVLNEFSIPSHEFYVYTALSENSLFTALGFDVLMASIWNLGGVYAVNISYALLFSLIFFTPFAVSSIFLARCQNIRDPINLTSTRSLLLNGTVAFCICCVFYFLNERANYRPEAFLYLTASFYLAYVTLQKNAKEKFAILGSRIFAFLLVIFLSNVHSTAPILIYFVVAADLFGGPAASKPISAKRLLSSTAFLCLLLGCSFLNPNGSDQSYLQIKSNWSTLAYGLTHPSIQSHGTSNQTVQFLNAEYLSVLDAKQLPSYIILSILAAITLILSKNKKFAFFTLAPFLVISFLHCRYLGLLAFTLIWTLPLAAGQALLDRIHSSPIEIARSVALGLLLVTLAAPFAYALSTGIFGFGIYASKFPERSYLAITHSPQFQQAENSNVFAFFHLGSYLASQNSRIHIPIDGHFVLPTSAFDKYNRVIVSKDEWLAHFREYDVKFALLPAALPVSCELLQPSYYIAQNPEWKIISSEPAGLTFEKRISPPDQTDKVRDARSYWLSAYLELQSALVSGNCLFSRDRAIDFAETAKRNFLSADAELKKLTKRQTYP